MQYSIILLSLATFCYSLPIAIEKTKHITLDGDGTITIDGSQGKKIVISRSQESSGQRNVDIYMEDKSGPIVKTWFKQQSIEDTEADKQRGMTEMDILVEIFKEYQGDIDDEKIIQQIRQFVRTGQVDINVLNMLRSFDSEEDQEDVITETRKSLSSTSLKKLLRIIKSLGMVADDTDIDRLIRRDPMFISRLIVGQEPINTADIVYLSSLLKNQRSDPMEMRQRWEMGLDNPMFTQDSEMTQKDIMDMQLMRKMQDPRFQRLLMTPNWMIDYDTMNPDMDSTMKMRHGMVMDDLVDPVMSRENNLMMEPETLDGNMTTRQWLRLVEQMEQEEMMKRLRERKIRQMIMQQRNRNGRNSPRTMMDQKNLMIMMDRMMPMM